MKPVDLYEVHRPGADMARAKTRDPVCGMAVDAEAAAARLQIEERNVVFCQHTCLQRFVVNPERYA